MFRPLIMFVGLRYTRAKRQQQFVSLISLISMLGIALGVLVLITILSVLNGFDREIKKSIFSMIAPITISNMEGQIQDWKKLEKIVQSASPQIMASAPFIAGQALLQNANLTQPVMLVGILPDKESRVSSLGQKMVQGNLFSLKDQQSNILLGEQLAKQLNLNVGDPLMIVTSQTSDAKDATTINTHLFKVSGIFHAGGGAMNFDSKLAYVHLSAAQQIFHLPHSVTALHATIKDIYSAPAISIDIQNQLPETFRVSNWTEQLGDFFENIRLTKTMMFFIFILIIVVAIFNLICSLVMIVNNKQADIAILRTMGATPMTIMGIFIVQGALVGLIGTLLGVIGGVLLSWNLTAIVDWIQHFFHVQLLSSNIYFVDSLPSKLEWSDVWQISLVAISLSLIATIYPAFNASRTVPVEALRSE